MRVFSLTSEGDCLGEISLILLHKEYDQKELQQRKVKTLTGISLRWFAKIQVQRFVHTKKGYRSKWTRDALVDWVTGTLYTLEGECYSSEQLKIVETDEEPYCSIRDMVQNFEYGRGSEYEIGSD
jgi:hypothetical protein